jgi:1,4-dihydroxy-2-naphthoate octaprenyltransferase
MLKNIIRALRLPFASASVLAFAFGSFINRDNFQLNSFLLGLVAAVATHLSANLINDYADSKSGADWQDKNFYSFFGGSKLIQEKVLSEKFYLYAALFCLSLAGLCVFLLIIILKSLIVIFLFTAIILLAFSYSHKPLQLSYRRLGEPVIFLLFGPVLVMGGYFIQTRIFPGLKSFILSLPFGFLTTAILFSNEVPDYADDKKAGKLTWVSLTGANRAFILYSVLIILAFLSILLGVFLKFMTSWALISWVLILPAMKAAGILKRYYTDKSRLMESSKLTIAVQALVSIFLVAGVFL